MPGDKSFVNDQKKIIIEEKEKEKEKGPKVYSFWHDARQAERVSERNESPTCVNGIPFTEATEGDGKPISKFAVLVYKTQKGIKDEICLATELKPEQKERLRKMYDLTDLPPGDTFRQNVQGPSY